ncbi:MAG: hypothetical protein P1U56_08120 [Saprospiraceae bacterium]|nr:hypothetical protein [Saprospiraceae bacterium]
MKHLLFTILLCSTLSLVGQETNQSFERKGFVIGFNVGGGVSSISDSHGEVPFDEVQGGISLPNLKIGWMLNERAALLASFPGILYEEEDKDRSFDAIIPSLQYWLIDNWWINGGVGLAMDIPALYESDLENKDWHFGGAISIGTGIELIQKKNFSLDISSNLLLGRVNIDDGESQHRDGAVFTVGIGFNWY